jgi:nucleotide-binding universal stress UspA family protein
MNDVGPARVIVGLSGSLASFQALRRAVAEARARGAALHVVHAYPATSTSQPSLYQAMSESRRDLAEERVAEYLAAALGGPPLGLRYRQVVVEGAGPVAALLAEVRGPDDLVVVGTGCQARRRPRWRTSVGERCLRRATCPVLVVPAPPLARELRQRRLRWRELEQHLAVDAATVHRLPRRH